MAGRGAQLLPLQSGAVLLEGRDVIKVRIRGHGERTSGNVDAAELDADLESDKRSLNRLMTWWDSNPGCLELKATSRPTVLQLMPTTTASLIFHAVGQAIKITRGLKLLANYRFSQ